MLARETRPTSVEIIQAFHANQVGIQSDAAGAALRCVCVVRRLPFAFRLSALKSRLVGRGREGVLSLGREFRGFHGGQF